MKRILFIIVLLTVGLLFYSVAVHAEEAVKIIHTKGSVKIQRSLDDFWILAKKGMLLKENDKIKTFIASEVEIAIDSTLKNIVKLDQNTEISIENIKTKRLSLPDGKIFALIESLPFNSSFEVRTPTAVAGVAGSGMSVGTDGKTTTVSCFEDRAYVRGINVDATTMTQIVIIDKGYKRIIGKFETPSNLLMLTMLDREGWREFRENLRDHLDWLRGKRAEGSRGAAIALEEMQRVQERTEDKWFGDKENIYEERELQRRDDWDSPVPASSGPNYD